MPEVRRQILAALDESTARLRAAVTRVGAPVDPAVLGQVQHAAAQLRNAELYWVTGPMADLAADAATDMPAYTPSVVMPALSGLLGLAEPLPPVEPSTGPGTVVTWAVEWAIRDGGLVVTGYARTSDLAPAQAAALASRGDCPWVGAWSIVAPLDAPTEFGGVSDLHRRVMLFLGAAWTLMQIPTVADVRTLRDRSSGGGSRRDRPPAPVRIVDLRRLVPAPAEPGDGGREYHHQWAVRGHWRQQAVGPQRSQRRPTWVAPHIKGPRVRRCCARPRSSRFGGADHARHARAPGPVVRQEILGLTSDHHRDVASYATQGSTACTVRDQAPVD